MEAELPEIERNGDVVFLERIKITSWSGMIMGISSFSTNWTVLPAVCIPEKAPSGQLNLKCLREKGSSGTTQEQMRYAIELCNSQERGSYEASSPPNRSNSSLSTQIPIESSATASTPSSSRQRDKFSLIKDVQIDRFYDLVGQVVKVYPSNGVVELYLTDYSVNNLLYNYEWGRDDPDAEAPEADSFYTSASSTNRKWPGPFGKLTLTVSLFPPHSYFAQNNVKENQFVFLRNTRVKWSKDGKMEGSLHTDRRNSDRIDITILKDHNDDRVKGVLRRKLEYTKKFQKQSDAFVEIARGQKRKQDEPPKLSKAQQRKRRKQQREQEARKKQNDLGSSDDEGNKENADPYHVHVTPGSKSSSHKEAQLTPSTSPPPAQPPKKVGNLNKNIRTSKPNIPPRPLSSILSLSTHALKTPNGTPYTLSFQNINSRAVVRVVDFFPPDIADFAIRRKRKSEFDVLSDCSEGSSSSSDDGQRELPPDTDDDRDDINNSQAGDSDNLKHDSKWQWRFALVLEDASSSSTTPQQQNQRLTAYVTDADAVFLLKLDACNLRRKPQALAALREKLFLLWGDLEERKRDEGVEVEGKARSMPFECCVREYGVRSRKGRGKWREWDAGDECGEGGEEGGEFEEGEGREEGREDEEENWGWERRFAMFGTTIL
ncbi:MAG: hypothetical protein Q9225_006652 [Loekoesia sp. 1 TL-2023]